MPVLTLLTAPDHPGIPDPLLGSTLAGLETGELRWLRPGRAVRVECDGDAGTLTDLRTGRAAAARDRGVDLVLRPDGAERRGRLLLADMDSTMIEQECIDELADLAGVGDQVVDITARAMNGELDFAEALAARVGLLAGLPQEALDRVLTERLTFAPGGRVLVATMRAHGARAALVSGGFTHVTGPVAAHLGFDEHRANVLEVSDGKLTGRVVPPVVGAEAKLGALHELAAGSGLSAEDVVAVGDGANDLPMLRAAGLGVALHAKPTVAAAARVRLDHADLTGVLHLQGYDVEEFADGPSAS